MGKRVVVTGMGLVTPLAGNLKYSWEKITRGESGISNITRFDASDISCQIAGFVPSKDEVDGFNPDLHINPKDHKKMDLFIHYGVGAADEAIKNSGLDPQTDEEKDRIGVLVGSGIGGLSCIEETTLLMKEKGVRRVSPFFIPASLINLLSGNISIKYGYSGPNHAVVTACSTGAHAIGDAANLIKLGYADVMIAGGAEAAICQVGMAGFAAARALSSGFNDRPTEASRPWDKQRDGFVMGEGSGIVVLEELEHAKKRGAKIHAELVGYGLTGDANHITAPHPEGRGGYRAMQMALNTAQINKEQIDYINAHGTSTPLGDLTELRAVKKLFAEHVYKLKMSSTKSSIGHLLGAAGSVEAIFSILAMENNLIPPTLNLHEPDEDCDIDLVPLKAKESKLNFALSNSFGFGGTNACLIFKRYNGN